MDVMALRAALAADPDTLLVDVRTPGEFRAACIDGAVNIPLDQLDAHLRRFAGPPGPSGASSARSGWSRCGIVASSVLASVRAPRLRYVAGAIGTGLVIAAVTDTCGLAMLLARLPWNRSSGTDIDADIDAAVARLRG